MKVIAKKISLSNEEVITRARTFFEGKFGFRLQTDPSDCCIEFLNDIGFITIQINNSLIGREVVIRTKEWEQQVEEFLKKL